VKIISPINEMAMSNQIRRVGRSVAHETNGKEHTTYRLTVFVKTVNMFNVAFIISHKRCVIKA